MGESSSSFIEVNGKRYDPKTGRLLRSSSTDVKKAVASPVQTQQRVRVIDGFTRRTQPNHVKKHNNVQKTTTVPRVTTQQSENKVQAQPRASQTSNTKPRTPTSHQLHVRTRKAQTLMRTAVKKPHQSAAVVKKASTPHQRQASYIEALTAKEAIIHSAQDMARAEKAQQIKTHTLIHKFAPQSARTKQKTVLQGETVYRRLQLDKPADTHTASIQSNSSTHRSGHDQLQSLINEAFEGISTLENNVAHKKKRFARIRRTPKWASIGASLAAVAILTGFFAYQNIPAVAMRMAVAKSGIDARTPSYRPSGFKFSGPISTSGGAVTLNFRSNSDSERSYTILQKPSNWDSQSLLDNFITGSKTAYQTYQDDSGRTIFIYEDSNATWVDQGIWYTIEGNARLNTDQLLKIASSM